MKKKRPPIKCPSLETLIWLHCSIIQETRLNQYTGLSLAVMTLSIDDGTLIISQGKRCFLNYDNVATISHKHS